MAASLLTGWYLSTLSDDLKGEAEQGRRGNRGKGQGGGGEMDEIRMEIWQQARSQDGEISLSPKVVGIKSQAIVAMLTLGTLTENAST